MTAARPGTVGVVLATRAPSNAGLWFVGRLQTDADQERVVEAMASEGGLDGADEGELSDVLKRLSPRWFAVRNMLVGRGET